MTSSRARFQSLSAGLVCASLLVSTGCNFIFNPAKSDDVIRCKNTTECEKEAVFFDALNTNRLDAACAAPSGGGNDFASSKTNQVCSIVDKASVSCGVEGLPASEFATRVEEAGMNTGVYGSCPTDLKGSLGCEEKTGGGCNDGLEANVFGVCDDGEGLPYYPYAEGLDLQDIKDQHCRSYFCDESFVCNNGKCSRCVDAEDSEDVAPGQGACGQLALSIGPSPVYLSQDKLEDGCQEASISEETKFGPVGVSPP
jgi:hypothetical protein